MGSQAVFGKRPGFGRDIVIRDGEEFLEGGGAGGEGGFDLIFAP